MYFLSKNYFHQFKTPLLVLTFLFTVFFFFWIFFPQEAFAMEPPQDTVEDFYGYKEYVGQDPYGHFHPNSISAVSHPKYELDSKPIYELGGKPVSGSIYTYHERDEVRYEYGMCLRGGVPVLYEIHPANSSFGILEKDADSYQGTISTLDSATWTKRLQDNIEYIKDYSIYVDNITQKKSLLSKISLCVKTTGDNIACIYI